MLSEKDPETQYRVGYEEGAWALLRALEGRLPSDAYPADETRGFRTSARCRRVAARVEVARGRSPTKVLPPALGYPVSN